MTALLDVRELQTHFMTRDGTARAVDGVSFTLERGQILGLVGESGSGKSVTGFSILGLVDPPGRVAGGQVVFDGTDLIAGGEKAMRPLRGKRIAMIFQDPSSSLNPVRRVGRQIEESLRLHRGLQGSAARAEAVRLMDMVGIPAAASRVDLYPHEFSGGQCQRVMIAMALAGQPDLLVADEPTTALDATIQAQILDLLARIRTETGMAMVFISHDLGAVSAVCDRAAVMYAGRIVERNAIAGLFDTPRHLRTAERN